LAALDAGSHVFVEKPMATDVRGAEQVVKKAEERGLVLLIGYILRVHPDWRRFIDEGKGLGSPLVMRFSLNQRSAAQQWETHKSLLASANPVVDSGVHYVDVMCQLTGSRPRRVQAMGARLNEDTPQGQVDYGQLQVLFENGSVGWFEAGWGPSLSREAEYVRDVIGPRGSVSLVALSEGRGQELAVHHSSLNDQGGFQRADERIALSGSGLDLQALCEREQKVFIDAIAQPTDLSAHHQAAVDALRIVLASEKAMRTGLPVELGE
jgi:predicted dehydrogenase